LPGSSFPLRRLGFLQLCGLVTEAAQASHEVSCSSEYLNK